MINFCVICNGKTRQKKRFEYFRKPKVENNYNRNYTHFYMIKKNILKRLAGYEAYSTQVLLDDFEKSDQINLETYIYDLKKLSQRYL